MDGSSSTLRGKYRISCNSNFPASRSSSDFAGAKPPTLLTATNTNRQTCAWDVRTKRVAYDGVETIDGVVAIANYGPTATLFTLGRNYTVQQYDLNPSGMQGLVANVTHPPANTPPSPPNSIEEKKITETPVTAHPASSKLPLLPVYLESETSEGEGVAMSPLQKIAQEMDQLEEERRDRVGPLSPVSSRGSQSSKSSGGSHGAPRYRYDKPLSSKSSKVSDRSAGNSTVFSSGSTHTATSRESVSIRSMSSVSSSRYASSSLRREVALSPEGKTPKELDLFPFIKARITEVPFKTPQYGPQRTPDDLRQQMLGVVFGWDNDIDSLVRDERECFLLNTLQ